MLKTLNRYVHMVTSINLGNIVTYMYLNLDHMQLIMQVLGRYISGSADSIEFSHQTPFDF